MDYHVRHKVAAPDRENGGVRNRQRRCKQFEGRRRRPADLVSPQILRLVRRGLPEQAQLHDLHRSFVRSVQGRSARTRTDRQHLIEVDVLTVLQLAEPATFSVE